MAGGTESSRRVIETAGVVIEAEEVCAHIQI